MQGAGDEFVKGAAKEVGPMHSRVAKMQGKLAKSELRRRGQGIAEGVAETLPMDDALKVLRQYGAGHFKTTSNELHFYKNGRPFSVDLIWNDDATRSVSLSQLNSATRRLKGQGVAEGQEQKKPLKTHKSGCGYNYGHDCDCGGTLTHASNCHYNYGHDCDCGLDKLKHQQQNKQQGVAEGSDIGYHQTSGTKAGYVVSSRKLSNKPQASKSDVTLQSGSMHHRGKSYNFPKGTLFTQLPGGIFAKHPDVPETAPGYGHVIRKNEDNINKIHAALSGVAEGDNTWGDQGRFAGDVKVDIGGTTLNKIQSGDTVSYFGEKAKAVDVDYAKNYARISANGKTLNVKLSDLKRVGGSVAETALRDKADLVAKRRALQDLSRDPGVDQKVVQQRQRDLEKEAKAKDLAESLLDEFAQDLDSDQVLEDNLPEAKMSPQQQNDFDRMRYGAMSRKEYDAKWKKPQKSDDEVIYGKKPSVTEAGTCNHTMEGEMCPEHGLAECGMHESQVQESQQHLADLARLKSLAHGK